MHVKASFVEALIIFIEFPRLGFDALTERHVHMILHVLTSLAGEEREPFVKAQCILPTKCFDRRWLRRHELRISAIIVRCVDGDPKCELRNDCHR